ncbi:uncharacterized protein [Fopius arisanus]|uniref:Cyclic nucleotide-binding domain-containing protein n=1 Tax=Fopius arisanus TaxID=64838 RepID=A0A9R1T1M3_9HYME|nr:PREDICTED: uncharacterized protein LOC105265356 [Fopius arisanus]
MQRKSSLRESLSFVRPKKKKFVQATRLRGKHLFRSAVRRVLEYLDWFTSTLSDEEPKDEVSIALAQRKKGEKKYLTLEDRSYLLTRVDTRTREDRSYILDLIKTLRAFRKYPEDVRESVSAICGYLYFGENRLIVRQHDPAHYLYYIIKGEVLLTKIERDPVTDDEVETSGGTLGPGDLFGEIALLHSLPRSTTVTTKTPVDLFYITKSDFDKLLKKTLLKNWNVLQDALVTFNYFKTWDEVTVRECCILSKIKEFGPNEILLGDGKGMVNYVYFLLSGKCRLIEHMIIFEQKFCNHVNYELYCPEKYQGSRHGSQRQSHRFQGNEMGADEDELDEPEVPDYAGVMISKQPQGKMDMDRHSVVTTTLQDVINQWHEITDVAAALMRQPSTASQQAHPEGVRTIFMQVCEFQRGACFGLGEEMRNRRIVSMTPVRCLLVPRYWLFEHNRGNIWERVKLFMNMKYPSKDQLFNKFVTDRRWIKYKKNMMTHIIKRGRNIYNRTTIHDVPYSIRIDEDIETL